MGNIQVSCENTDELGPEFDDDSEYEGPNPYDEPEPEPEGGKPKMKCENCGHLLIEAESYYGEGDVRMVLVHSTQSMTSLPCEDVCICGCEKAKKEAGK